MQNILSLTRKAIEDFNLIEENDKIAVCVSGGKDSTTLLMALKNLQIFYPKHFELMAICINPGFEEFDEELIKNTCAQLDIPLIVENSHAKEIIFDIRKEKNPCSLCANLRRGILNSIAKEHGFNKLAVGHNLDDFIETFVMNLFYNGNPKSFAPKIYMDRSEMSLIRPLIYIPEKQIKKFIKENNIPIMKKCCPIDGVSKREDIKKLIKSLSLGIPKIKENLFGAIKRNELW